MKSYTKEIFIFIVLFQIEIICLTLYRINQKLVQKKIFEQTQVTEIRKIDVASISGSLLKYYYEMRPGVVVDYSPWVKEKVTWTINSDTLNDRFDYQFEKSSGTYRIIALGDSWTFGDHINTKDSWPEKLEDMLNKEKPCPTVKKYEVINLGVRGYDIQDEVERYRLRGINYKPDLVLWMMIKNDFDEINELILPMEKIASKITGEDLNDSKRNSPIRHFQYYDLSRTMFAKTYNEQTIHNILQSFLSIFNSLYQGPLITVTFKSDVKESHIQFIRSWLENRQNSYLLSDMPNLFKSGEKLDDGHPSVEGYEAIAERIYKNLKTNPLFCMQ